MFFNWIPLFRLTSSEKNSSNNVLSNDDEAWFMSCFKSWPSFMMSNNSNKIHHHNLVFSFQARVLQIYHASKSLWIANYYYWTGESKICRNIEYEIFIERRRWWWWWKRFWWLKLAKIGWDDLFGRIEKAIFQHQEQFQVCCISWLYIDAKKFSWQGEVNFSGQLEISAGALK